MKQIAVLMTCYNRVETTLRCLQGLFAQKFPEGYGIDVWLVDDASPDKTGAVVKGHYPSVHVVRGTGNLFWSGGMRLAWKTAAAELDYDFFLWLNDDVELYAGAIRRMLSDYEGLGPDAVVCGALLAPELGTIYYGGPELQGRKTVSTPVLLTTGLHGNVVLIPRCVYLRVGGMAEGLVHQHGDFEYGYRARKNGVKVYAAGEIIGTCKANYGFEKRRMLSMPLRERWKVMFSPKCIGLMDYYNFKRLTVGLPGAIASLIKGVLTALFPRLFIRSAV